MKFKEPGSTFSSKDWEKYFKKDNENQADALIDQGDFDGAFELLKRAHKNDQPGRSAQLNMKIASLPFAEINYRLKQGIDLDVGLIDDAEAVHGMVGELLYEQLLDFSLRQPGTAAYSKGLGDISELTVLCLGARHFNQTGESFMVPAAKSNDHAQRFASDLRLIEIDPRAEHNLQIKTSSHVHHLDYYSNLVTILPVSKFDPIGHRHPDRHRSIARSLTRELSGDYTPTTQYMLDRATRDMFHVIMNDTR